MIIIAFVSGLTLSLIPNIASSHINGDMKDVNNKINQSFQIIMFVNLPMVLGLHLLAGPVWNMFYGNNIMGIELFSLYIFQALTFSFYSISIDSAQIMGNTKLALSALFGSFLLKAILNVPFMYLFNAIGLKAGYAPIVLNLILHMATTIVIAIVQSKKYGLNYKQSFNPILKSILIALIMFVSLKIMALFIPVDIEATKLTHFLLSLLYGVVGGAIYIITSYRYNLIDRVFKVDSRALLTKILIKLKLKKSTN